MQLRRIIKITLVVICLIFLGLQILKLNFEAAAFRMLLFMLLTLLYFAKIKERRLFFVLFLLAYTLAEIIEFSSYFFEVNYDSIDYFYYIINGLYIMSYVFLIIRLLQDMNLEVVLKNFWVHLAILIVLDVFCVIILIETTEKRVSAYQLGVEIFYNSVFMALLTIAMINYISRNTQKAMNFLLGAIFIFFSEVIQIAYLYVDDNIVLKILYSLFMILAFLFFYLQARIPFELNEDKSHQDLIV